MSDLLSLHHHHELKTGLIAAGVVVISASAAFTRVASLGKYTVERLQWCLASNQSEEHEVICSLLRIQLHGCERCLGRLRLVLAPTCCLRIREMEVPPGGIMELVWIGPRWPGCGGSCADHCRRICARS